MNTAASKKRLGSAYTRPGAGGSRDAAPEEMSRLSPSTGPPEGPTPLGIRERGRARRRLRYLRRLRELQLRDAGGFVFDLYRFGERRDALVRAKLDALIATDKEIRHLEALLDDTGRRVEIRQPGVGGTCPSCGAFHGSDARFCAHCGVELKTATPTPAPSEEAPAGEAAAEEPLTEEPVSEEAPTEDPLTEESVPEKPVADKPIAEEPVAEEDGDVPVPLPEEIVAERLAAEEAAGDEAAAGPVGSEGNGGAPEAGEVAGAGRRRGSGRSP
jgi:hypothetical protein